MTKIIKPVSPHRRRRTRPRKARCGIRPRRVNRSLYRSWWALGWIRFIERYAVDTRMARGRSYARSGQVVSVEIRPGLVRASVQGTRIKPYDLRISLPVLDEASWRTAIEFLTSSHLFIAKLLSGEIPEKLDSLVPILPRRLLEFTHNCQCGDWASPCKHAAAVHYLLAGEFDSDPFLLLKLRGRDRDSLLELIAPRPHDLPATSRLETEPEAQYPLDPEQFWVEAGTAALPGRQLRVPAVHATLPRRLGPFPFWRGDRDFLEIMEDIYRQASWRGLNFILGKTPAAGLKKT